MTRLAYRGLLAGTCAYGALVSGAAAAQTATPTPITPTPATQAAAAEEGTSAPAGEITVTGSRIARPDYVADSPIISISQDTFENTGRVTLERALGEMPQFTGAFGASNGGSTSTGLNGGQAYASLRGLGPKRTLLLLDGRRLQPSNPDGSVDLNIIPEALVDNVEVITGGASTTYGSDATAGVVNFKLRRNFTGIELNGSYGISDYGDGRQFRIGGVVGVALPDGRGSAVIGVDYTNRKPAWQYERDYYTIRQTTAGTATPPQGEVLFGANTPLLSTVNTLFQGRYGTAALPGSGGRYTGRLGFNRDGTIYSSVGVPVLNFRDPQTDLSYIVNNGSAANQQVNFGFTGSTIQNDLKRYNIFGKVNYELTDNIESFVQVTYTSYSSLGITNPTLASNVYQLNVPYNNPFIPADMRTVLASRAQPTADFIMYKAFNIAGPRYQGYSYDVYQITGGLSGKLGIKDWTWDIYGSVSKAKFLNTQTGGVSDSAVRAALYSPTGGTELCAGGLNLFGDFNVSPACVAYISRRTVNQNELRQRTVEANLQGALFDMWAGEVRFALGADYRYNGYGFVADSAFNNNPATGRSDILGYSVLLPASGSVNTKEIYGELLVPLLKDVPAFRELNLNLGYRYSDYNSVGGVHTYKATLDWQVFQPLRLRGGYNRAIRAPSVGELYAPVSTASVGIGAASATTTNGDPCDRRSSFRAANPAGVRAICLAQGIPAGLYDTYQLGSAQLFALNGGNPDLEEEKADTFSAGAVVTSPFETPLLRRISFSVDAYKIKVKNAIGPLSIAQGIQNCFNAGGSNPSFDPSNYYCGLVGQRNPATGVPVNPTQPLLNLGAYDVQGIDFQLDWRIGLSDLFGGGEKGSFSFNTAVSYTDKFKIQALPGGPTYDYAGAIGSAGQVEAAAGIAHPKWKTVTSGTYSLGSASLGLRWRFIDKMIAAARVVTPTSTVRGIDAYNVFDLNLRIGLKSTGTEIRGGITNLFNKKPPQLGDDIPNYDAQNYDVIGRYFFIGFTQKF